VHPPTRTHQATGTYNDNDDDATKKKMKVTTTTTTVIRMERSEPRLLD
jgi:hypothetical protein